ncbi:hypothetical protein WMY93_005861 [Mugilogobius chulae]|uniref:SH3 domain-containing protein n=1 Tax=Mugilogobius chulae TaxID=88201 RepID=A0AAW0PKR9_9GOBI
MSEEKTVRRTAGDTRNTGPSNKGRTDRTQSSQGPLSSLKAVIKRTKTSSQSDHKKGNYRRRPEITVLSAEPLDCSKWSTAGPQIFSAPHNPPPQVGWPQLSNQKTEEVQIKPVASPRHLNCTTTSTTTTSTATAAPKPAGKKPPKPPRPSAPKNQKTSTAGLPDVNLTLTPSQNNNNSNSNLTEQLGSTRSVTVHWNNTASSDTTAAFSNSAQCPVPLPRIKSKRPLIQLEEPQTLVQINNNSDPSKFTVDSVSTNKYLEELLEVFNSDNLDIFKQSSAETEHADEMSGTNSFRSRIQAFENQAEEASEPGRPQPQARRPSVASKPSVTIKPQVNSDNLYDEVSPLPPATAKKPLSKTNSVKEELNAVLAQHRSKPKLTRDDSIYDEDYTVKPVKEPLKPNLNINNHNNYTAQPVYEDTDYAANYSEEPTYSEYEYVETQSYPLPVKPKPSIGNGNHYSARPSMTRRPTTIIVPSKSASFSDGFQDSAPALPVQKPVGALKPSPAHRHSIASFPPQSQTTAISHSNPSTSPKPTPQAALKPTPQPALKPTPQPAPKPTPQPAFKPALQPAYSPTPQKAHRPAPQPGYSPTPQPAYVPTPQSYSPTPPAYSPTPQPSLPPRRLTTSKTLPPRPPLVKSSPGRPPPPRLGDINRSNSTPWDSPPKLQAQGPNHRGPLQVPHAVASTDYNGSNNGELSFQKNEVLVLLNPIDSNTYECQVGDRRGRVHTSSMKVITPLSSEVSQDAQLTTSGNGLTVEALHDFTPENPGELGLKAGDMVTMVEQVDSECLDKITTTSRQNRQKPAATISGPRCVARFDFEGEQSDELSFSEGDVIQLKAYVGQDWARGQLGNLNGIFPLNFVEIVQDLPPAPSQQQPKPSKIALPGMAKSSFTQMTPQAQAPPPGSEWAVALYDFSGTQKEICPLRKETASSSLSTSMKSGAQADSMDEKAYSLGLLSQAKQATHPLEELSLKVGDIVTNIEIVDKSGFRVS